jgi:predicted ATP-dependent endonuclease of OLD family
LGLPTLKNIQSNPDEKRILDSLENILEGKILLERGRFYLVSNSGKTEISLIAEGIRKIGTISHLIANGSLNKNSILFWDEPEANLNPRLIKKIAKTLFALSNSGVQVFIVTHSLFLVKEIEILRRKNDQVKYFGLGIHDNRVTVSQDEIFEHLEYPVILDEEFLQDDRFSEKEDI